MAYADVILADSPHVYYRLEEPSGTDADNAEGTAARDGTYVGSPTLDQAGVADSKCPTFDGSDDLVTCTSIAALDDLAAGSLMIEAWVFPTTSKAQAIVSCWGADTVNQQVTLELDADEKIVFACKDATVGYIIATSDAAINLNEWTYIAVRWLTTTTIAIYVNGSSVAITYAASGPVATLNTTTELVRIGSSGTGETKRFAGKIDEVAIYTASNLTAAKVLEHFQAEDGTPPDAPTIGTATAAGTDAIDLTWTDNADDEDDFRVQYDTVNTFDDDPQELVIETEDTESTEVGSLLPNTTYYFRVRAENAFGNSDWSDTVSATTDAEEAEEEEMPRSPAGWLRRRRLKF
jgi:hypothetical protein